MGKVNLQRNTEVISSPSLEVCKFPIQCWKSEAPCNPQAFSSYPRDCQWHHPPEALQSPASSKDSRRGISQLAP